MTEMVFQFKDTLRLSIILNTSNKNVWSNVFWYIKVCIFWKCIQYTPVDTGRKLNVHKTFRSRPWRLLNVLCTFNLRPVSTGTIHWDKTQILKKFPSSKIVRKMIQKMPSFFFRELQLIAAFAILIWAEAQGSSL